MTGKLYVDDLRVGDRWFSDTRTLTSGDVATFAELTGDCNPIHLDEGYAENTPFRRPIAHGILSLAIGAGLGSMAPALHEVVLLSIEQWRFGRPVYPGDSVYLVNEVIGIEGVTRRRGQVTWLRQLFNQDDELVQSGIFTTLVAARSGRRVLKHTADAAGVAAERKLPVYPR